MNNFVPARELDARKGSYSNIPNRGLRMSRMSIITGLLLLSTAACGRSTTSEQAPADPAPAAPTAAPDEIPTEDEPEMAAEMPAKMPSDMPDEGSAEAPPPMPTDHRLHLGVDGDTGYTQQELTPEELAAEKAAAGAEPTYPVEPSEPTEPAQPNEDSEEVVEGSSDPYYMGERRAPVIRHEVREEVRREDEVREDLEAEHRGEAAPVERGRR